MRWLLLFIPIFAYASGDDDHHDGGGDGGDGGAGGAGGSVSTVLNDTTSLDSSVNNAINTESMSIAAGFGGVEIKDCIYTVQYFILFQGAKINPLCVADKLDAIGKHKEAAQMRCSIRRYWKPYGNKNQCIRVTMYVAPNHDEHDEHVQQQEEQMILQQQVIQLQEQYDELQKAPPQRVETRTVTEQKPWMSDETRSKLQSILDEEEQ